MANDKEKPGKGAEPAAAEGAPKKGGMMKMVMAGGIVVVLEVVTVVVTMMMSSGPKKVIAEVPTSAPAEAVVRDVELKLPLDALKFPNRKGGVLYMYDLQVVVTTVDKNKTKLKESIDDHEGQIKDHLRTIIANTDPQSFAEPGLETLRRQIGYQLEQDLGKEMIKEVLIPKCLPIRAEF